MAIPSEGAHEVIRGYIDSNSSLKLLHQRDHKRVYGRCRGQLSEITCQAILLVIATYMWKKTLVHHTGGSDTCVLVWPSLSKQPRRPKLTDRRHVRHGERRSGCGSLSNSSVSVVVVDQIGRRRPGSSELRISVVFQTHSATWSQRDTKTLPPLFIPRNTESNLGSDVSCSHSRSYRRWVCLRFDLFRNTHPKQASDCP